MPGVVRGHWLFWLGLALVLASGVVGWRVRGADGVTVHDIRFAGAAGNTMGALLYVPATATTASPAPGILAVHGYINTREMQDGFAIEFARRGYVVLELDQTGHGYSDPPAFAEGFGGPDGLRYLRALPFVDKRQIGLEGHSMGGWTVLAAAAALPAGYRAMVLEGSSTGAPYAPEGTAAFPRNLALVYSRRDEFSQLMWGVPRAVDVTHSAKAQALFGTPAPIVPGQTYGAIDRGTARILYQPPFTHPWDHVSPEAIGRATDWFARTLRGGHPRPAGDQIWYWKEIATGIGLVGFLALLLGGFDWLARTTPLRAPRGDRPALWPRRDSRWWTSAGLATAGPALLFFPVFIIAGLLLPASAPLPQAVTNQVLCWALASAALAWLVGRWAPTTPPLAIMSWGRAAALAIGTVTIGYAALGVLALLFGTDLRLWVVAVKLPSPRQWALAAEYALPMILAYVGLLRGLPALAVAGDGRARAYASAVAILCSGFALMLAIDYGALFTTGRLLTAIDPLSTVIAIQFVPLLAAIAVIATFTWRRTASHRPGAILVGLLVTLYVCAGTATQA